jgi:hypothetical protein
VKSSFDDRGLQRLQENLSRIGGTDQVPLTELLSPEFMSKHTDYPSFEAMLAASRFTVKTAEDFKDTRDDEWECHVRKVTRFDSWLEMQKEAGVAWLRGQLLRGVG